MLAAYCVYSLLTFCLCLCVYVYACVHMLCWSYYVCAALILLYVCYTDLIVCVCVLILLCVCCIDLSFMLSICSILC